MAVSRLVSRSFVRNFSASPFTNNEAEAAKTAIKWKKIFFFVAVPCCLLAHVNVYLKTQEEKEHFVRPPFVPYDCVRIRTKRFPWGDGTKGLFHNPHVNALPTGYEDEH